MSQENVEKNDENSDLDESQVVTMVDVLQDEEELEEDANAVLGPADDQNCTFDQGYCYRQPLYSCTTCCVDDNAPACGVCLACSYDCHEGHDLVELYTKRNFRCDCGNPKMAGATCKLKPDKSENPQNKYNQNFRGVYCECARPYPDPDDSVKDEMIQCLVCEDWYHGRHLGLESGLPSDSDYGEMICRGCVDKYPLLGKYHHLSVNKKPKEAEKKDGETSAVDVAAENSAKDSTDEKCKIINTEVMKGTLFMPENWRENICKCSKCCDLMKENDIAFITDPKDTVHYYESQSKKNTKQIDDGMAALSQMDRTQQVEAIHQYNDMKDHLMQYLAKFKQNGKVVREEDIKNFFQEMKSKKAKYSSFPPSSCK